MLDTLRMLASEWEKIFLDMTAISRNVFEKQLILEYIVTFFL